MIILFCGIPGCGKTTIAKLLAERLTGLGSVQLLSSDDLKSPVYRKLFSALAPERRRANFVILDATFYKKEWRGQVSALANGEELITVYITCPVEIAIQRNRERQPTLAERVVHIMSHRMEPPDNPNLTIDTSSVAAAQAAESIFNFIQAVTERPTAS
jgi:tRNA uridine 5-carbamoylmethylation protein Kti12